jgi:hypothetical protein
MTQYFRKRFLGAGAHLALNGLNVTASTARRFLREYCDVTKT